MTGRVDDQRSGRVDMELVLRAFGTLPGAIDRLPPEGHHAVVAVVLRDTLGGIEVLLIRRSSDDRDPWSGHMALPGGHRDVADEDVLATAARETSEEVGLDLLQHAQFLGRLASTRAVARGRSVDFTIVPLVFALLAEREATGNPREVQEIVWARLEHLLSPAGRTTHEYQLDQQRHRLPAFDVDGRTVWGLTYRILENLLGVLTGALGPARVGSSA